MRRIVLLVAVILPIFVVGCSNLGISGSVGAGLSGDFGNSDFDNGTSWSVYGSITIYNKFPAASFPPNFPSRTVVKVKNENQNQSQNNGGQNGGGGNNGGNHHCGNGHSHHHHNGHGNGHDCDVGDD